MDGTFRVGKGHHLDENCEWSGDCYTTTVVKNNPRGFFEKSLCLSVVCISVLLIAWDSMPYPVNSLALATGNQQFGTWVFEMDSGQFSNFDLN